MYLPDALPAIHWGAGTFGIYVRKSVRNDYQPSLPHPNNKIDQLFIEFFWEKENITALFLF